ncbi:MAG: helix-turn-helix domain-containing protein [Pseudonocardiaceae bacterium]
MANETSTGVALGARIREYRLEKGLNQAALAEGARLSKTYISELESGAGRRPSGEVLLRIADALGVTIADLLGRSVLPALTQELPDGLAEFATNHKLPEADVAMLASIRFRGEPPRTARRWQHIYDAIRTSKTLDEV